MPRVSAAFTDFWPTAERPQSTHVLCVFSCCRVLYGAEPDKIRSERACLLTMYAANKYLCSKLFLHCVAAADAFLAPANVLRVMQAVRMFVPDNMEVQTVFSPSAPPFEDSR